MGSSGIPVTRFKRKAAFVGIGALYFLISVRSVSTVNPLFNGNWYTVQFLRHLRWS